VRSRDFGHHYLGVHDFGTRIGAKRLMVGPPRDSCRYHQIFPLTRTTRMGIPLWARTTLYPTAAGASTSQPPDSR
jgi:hypothetical protein